MTAAATVAREMSYFFFWLHQALVAARGRLSNCGRLSCRMACGILVPQPRIEPMSPAFIERQIPNQ